MTATLFDVGDGYFGVLLLNAHPKLRCPDLSQARIQGTHPVMGTDGKHFLPKK